MADKVAVERPPRDRLTLEPIDDITDSVLVRYSPLTFLTTAMACSGVDEVPCSMPMKSA